MINNSRGQISVEFVLIIGLILVFVLAIAGFIGPSLQQDQVMSAARSGFISASNSIAYNGAGNVLRLNNLTFNSTSGVITASYFSKNSLSTTQDYTIRATMVDYISKTLNIPVTNRTSVKPGTVTTNQYNYTVILASM